MILFRNDNLIKVTKNNRKTLQFTLVQCQCAKILHYRTTVCEFISSLTSFSHEKTIKSSNLSFGILLFKNVFKIFSLLNDLLQISKSQQKPIYSRNGWKESHFQMRLNCKISCYFGFYYFAFHLFLQMIPKHL